MENLKITAIGNQGEGVAELDETLVYVPFTLAGETIKAEVTKNRGRLVEIDTPSPERGNTHLPILHYLRWLQSATLARKQGIGMETRLNRRRFSKSWSY